MARCVEEEISVTASGRTDYKPHVSLGSKSISFPHASYISQERWAPKTPNSNTGTVADRPKQPPIKYIPPPFRQHTQAKKPHSLHLEPDLLTACQTRNFRI